MCEKDGNEDDDEKGREDAHCGKEMGKAGKCGGKRKEESDVQLAYLCGLSSACLRYSEAR